jgi:hypothetical protein
MLMQKTEKNIISKFVHLFTDEYFWYENNKNEKAEVFYTNLKMIRITIG